MLILSMTGTTSRRSLDQDGTRTLNIVAYKDEESDCVKGLTITNLAVEVTFH